MSTVAEHPGSLKAYQAGTDRVVTPSATVARLTPLFPFIGITRVADVTGLDHLGIPVVMVVRPNARSLSVAQGKGIDLAAAQASGIMESVETWHAEHMELPLRLGSVDDVRFRLPLAELDGLPRCREMPYSPEAPLLWVEGRELTSDKPLFVPYELVHTNYTLPRPTGAGMFLATSNGLASGNIPAEAHSHALSEVIERDATSLWRLRAPEERRRTRLDLATVDDPLCAELLRTLDRAGIATGVWETTTDIGVAAFYCVIVDREDSPLNRLHAAGGMGCHPNRGIALMRALTEAAQSRLTLIAGSRDDVVEEDYRRARAPRAVAEERAQILDEPGVVAFPTVPTAHLPTVEEDVRHQVACLRAVGLEQVITVDLTHPDLGIPVARVIVPGLEALSEMPGYTAGRRARAVAREGRS
jgi:ribosomal protein S12 methylthiotransferase accessory factor